MPKLLILKFLNLFYSRKIEKIFVVTHPHKLQLTTQKYPIDVSDIVKMTVKNYKKVLILLQKDLKLVKMQVLEV